MVKLQSLKNDPKKRVVYRIVDTPTGQITIYEPTKDDIKKIIELQDEIARYNEDNEMELEIAGYTVMRELIPMLTDIEIDPEMSDDEVRDIADNPTLALLTVTHVLEGIVSDVYKMLILQTVNGIKNDDIEVLVDEMKDQVSGSLIERMSKTEDGREAAAEVAQETMRLVNAKQNEYIEDEMTKAEVAKELEEDQAVEEIVNEDDDTSDVEPTEPAELVDAVVVDEPSTSYEDRIKSKFQANYSELNGEAE